MMRGPAPPPPPLSRLPLPPLHTSSMTLWEGYSQCWQDFISRMDHGEKLVDHLKCHRDALCLPGVCHLLSVGPGTGTIDAGLIALLPNLQLYTGLEPDGGRITSLRNNISHYSHIEKVFVQDILQTYAGPEEPCDIILMSHVAYYFSDCLEEQLRRTLSWLRHGGAILVVLDQNTIHKIIESEFDIRWPSDLMTVEVFRERLTRMGMVYEEQPVYYTLDVSQPGEGYYDFFSIMMNRKASRDEIDKALGLIEKVFIPGTKTVKGVQSLFVIKKQ